MTKSIKSSLLGEKKSSSWWLYMIETECGFLYTGITTDVERRFNEHRFNKKKAAKFFRGRKAKQVVYRQYCENRSQASQLEAHIKKLSRTQKLDLIKHKNNKESVNNAN